MQSQVFCIHKSIEIIIINEDKNLVFAALQVVTPSLKSFNNSQKLLIVNFIVFVNKDHLLRKKNDWISITNFALRRN